MKSLLFVCLILSQSLFAQRQSAEVMGQSLCFICSMQVQQILRPFMKSNSQPASVIFVNNNSEILDEQEQSAIRKITRDISDRSAFAKRLIEQSRLSQSVNLRIYYQFGLNLEGKTSLYDNSELPAYEVNQRYPHELWGFFYLDEKKSFVLLNEYQHPWNAWTTLVHELFHIFDFKTKKLIEDKQQAGQAWTSLDDLAAEFRAHLAEVYFRKELRQYPHFSREPLLKQDYRDRFISGETIDTEALADYTYELFYPQKQVASQLRLDSSKAPNGMELSYNPSQQEFWKKSAPTEILNAGAVETALWFFSENLKDRGLFSQKMFSAIQLYYRLKSSNEIRTESDAKRKEIESLIEKSGSKNFHEYLKKIGFVDQKELQTGLLIGNSIHEALKGHQGSKPSPIRDSIPFSGGGTSPRINGGG